MIAATIKGAATPTSSGLPRRDQIDVEAFEPAWASELLIASHRRLFVIIRHHFITTASPWTV
jgi:hypothetical protein